MRMKKEVNEDRVDFELNFNKEENLVALVSSQLQEIENLRANLS